MNLSKAQLAVILLAIFHVVGTVGMSLMEFRPLFLGLTPFHLLLTLVLFAFGNTGKTEKLNLAFLFVFLTGFLVEVAGVQSGLLFGEYWYSNVLGYSILGVPLLIGVNWFLLSAASYGISKKISSGKILSIIIGALLTAGIDVVIEPVAIDLEFWSWQGNTVPIQNYLMWFLTALFIQFVLHRIRLKLDFFVCAGLYACQLIFFSVLNFTL